MGTGDPAALRALAAQRELAKLLTEVLVVVTAPPAEPQPEYFI